MNLKKRHSNKVFLIFLISLLLLIVTGCQLLGTPSISVGPSIPTCCIDADGGIPRHCINKINSPGSCSALFANVNFITGQSCYDIPECEGKIRCIAKDISLDTIMEGGYTSTGRHNITFNDGVKVCEPDLNKEGIEKVLRCDGMTGRFVQETDCAETDKVCAYGACVNKVDPAKVWWKFDEGSGQSIDDSSAYNYDAKSGTSTSGDTSEPAWTTDTQSETGYALKFDGVDDFVRMNTNPQISHDLKNGFTIEAWIKPDDFGRYRTIASKPWMFLFLQRGNGLCFYVYINKSLELAQQNFNLRQASIQHCGFCYPWVAGCTVPANPYYNPYYDSTDPSSQKCVSIILSAIQPSHPDGVCTGTIFGTGTSAASNSWTHVAATYNAQTRTMQIYAFNPTWTNQMLLNRPLATMVIRDIETVHDGESSLGTGGEGTIYIGQDVSKNPFNGTIDQVKVYNYAKTCFDLFNQGICEGECSFLPKEEIYTYYGHLRSAKPPSYGYCNLDDPTLLEYEMQQNIRKLNTTFPNCLINPGNPRCWPFANEVNDMCVGDRVKFLFTKRGGFVVEKEIKGNIDCDSSCFESCNQNCMDIRIEDCLRGCTRFCSNWVCLSQYYQTYCGGANGQNVSICTTIWSHAGTSSLVCANFTLAPDETTTVCKDECATQCNQNIDVILQKTSYWATCPYDFTMQVEVRKVISGQGPCQGQLIDSYTLQSDKYGTVKLDISMPSQPGDYQICADGQVAWEGRLWKESKEECDKAYACILKIEEPKVVVEKNQKGTTVTVNAILTNVGADQNYDLFVYSKVSPDENEATGTGTIPPYLRINPSDKQTGNLKTGDSFTISIALDIPALPFKFNPRACEKGKKGGCEYDPESLTTSLPYYADIILKAKGKVDAFCEVPFDVDLTETCMEEVCENNIDDDCDDLIDDGIIAVEVVDQDIETDTDPETGESILRHGSPTPLEGTKVYFLRYKETACVDSLGLSNPEAWQNYQTIVDSCKSNADTYHCITDSEGYCEAEVPIHTGNGDHFLAIAVDSGDVVTTKHFGVPVSMVKCGKVKKVWHLSSHP